MFKKFLISVLIFTSTVFAQQQINFQTAMLYKADINSLTAYKMQQEGTILIDVRTKREFQASRAKGSINIPIFYEEKGQRVFNKSFPNEIYYALEKNLEKKVILICRSGSRTKLASNLLAYQGFKNVYNIKNGFQYDWAKIKLPIE